MQTHLGKLSISTVAILYSALFHNVCASQHFGAFPLLSVRDETCPDGGTCAPNQDDTGLVCCPSSQAGTSGCMQAGSVCCGYGFYCGPGQFCSPPNNGEVNCCFDSACSTVVDIGINVIAYTDASLFTAKMTAAATTTAAGSAQTTGTSTPTTKSGSSATNGSPAATKTSAGELMVKLDMAGLLLPLFALVWTLLGA
ncbi:hypothetical protein V8E51_008820 [Hyaloscypha variabilis]